MNQQRDIFIESLVLEARKSFFHFSVLVNMFGLLPHNLIISECHKYLVDLVQGMHDGTEGTRQCISVPPQHGKSTFLSVLASAWEMGVTQDLSVALTGYSHELVCDFSRQVQHIVTSPVYQLIFPDVTVSSVLNRQDYWQLSNGSVLRAKSVGKKLTGRRVDVLVVDDPHPGRREAESSARRKEVVDWFFGDCVTRMSPEGKIRVVGTRFHPLDLIGHLMSPQYTEDMKASGNEDLLFEFHRLEAICTDKEADPLGREVGAALFPEVRTLRFLEGLRAGGVPSYEWESQYQGKPQTAASNQVDLGKLKRIDISDVPKDIERGRGWDLALTEKKSSDFSCGGLCAYNRDTKEFYIMDMRRMKLMWPRLRPRIIASARQDMEVHNAHRLAVEAVAGFDIAYQELKQELLGEVKVEKRNPVTDKLLRAQPWLNLVEAGKVYLVRGGWNREFLDELRVFPDGDHDDQIDAVSIAYELLAKRQARVLC